MKKMMKTNRRNTGRDKGSALLVSLMVMVGLSLLGLAFVAISETENAISINERNYAQTLHVAEAGARTVSQWFNDPEWAHNTELMPDNTAAIKQRRVNNIITAGAPDEYYKYPGSDLLCDIPYNQHKDRFYGVDENSADVNINYTNAATFLDRFNELLFHDSNEGGRVVNIRIYGPPVVAGTITTTGGRRYWNHDVGTRYGLATIAVTAEKTRDGSLTGQVLARRTVRMVVAEFPLPGADGPLQSGQGTGTTGNFRVHWGKVISNREIAVKRLHTALPWINAWNIIRYEDGYAPEHTTSGTEYLLELINKEFEDPWFWVSARMTADPPPGSPAVSGTNQLWTYSVNDDETAEGNGGYSGHFQNQNTDNIPTQKNTFFTRPVYDVWKQIALAGAGQQGIYYLRYNATTQKWYDTLGDSRTFAEWVNVEDGGEEGFFFFDTTTGGNPQNTDGTTNTGILTPALSLTSGNAGNPFLMRGFFYINMVSFGTQGLQSPGKYVNYPGEPFRDVGYQKVNITNGELMCDDASGGSLPVDCGTGSPVSNSPFIDNETNDVWDYQELNGNNTFDYVVQLNPTARVTPGTDTADIPASTYYFIVPYSEACGIAGIGTTCSEPHEPYLNIVYPHPFALGGGSNPVKLKVLWQNPTTIGKPKKVDSAGDPITCTATSSRDDCTSNAYDKKGPMVILGSQASDGPALEGVIYNEGNYDAGGQAIYYGALLFQGTVSGNGTPTVFFDDSLATGEWAQKFENMPRTIVTTIETDQ